MNCPLMWAASGPPVPYEEEKISIYFRYWWATICPLTPSPPVPYIHTTQYSSQKQQKLPCFDSDSFLICKVIQLKIDILYVELKGYNISKIQLFN